MSRTLGVLALVLGVGAASSAQDKVAQPAAAPPALAMTAEGKRFLGGWLGQWTASDATVTLGAQKMPMTLKMNCESVSAGWGTLCSVTFDIKGLPPSAATFLLGWDVATGQGHMFEVVDTGEVHSYSGKWTSDKAIALVHQGKNPEGKPEKDACAVTWASARQLALDCSGTQAGATAWTLKATSRK
jgi:hypothetical protein